MRIYFCNLVPDLYYITLAKIMSQIHPRQLGHNDWFGAVKTHSLEPTSPEAHNPAKKNGRYLDKIGVGKVLGRRKNESGGNGTWVSTS